MDYPHRARQTVGKWVGPSSMPPRRLRSARRPLKAVLTDDGPAYRSTVHMLASEFCARCMLSSKLGERYFIPLYV
jgi:hypothetical protein